MNKEDLVVGLSVSGNSKNVVSALRFAKEQNIPEDVILESFQQAANMADYLVNIAI